MFDGTLSPDNLLLVGRIVRTHGLKGECKVVPESDDPNRLRNLKRIWLGDTPQTAQPYNVESTRLQNSRRGTTVLMQFTGIHTVTDAKGLGKPLVFADLNDLPPLQPGEFFLHDLIGVEVVTDEGESVGTLKDIWDTQSHSLYLIERPGKKEALIPAVPAFIVSTDVDRRRVVIRTVEGLLD
ncbi:MAG: ribosome maturation factor RimM [Bacteroidetes bacterium]|nr:ribosome maturation factor RimM [Bacteroidota bacterium]